jgi:hypothetical protein
MPTEAPSPFVRFSPDVVFSRDSLALRLEEEPFSLCISAVHRAPRPRMATAREAAAGSDIAPAEQQSLF